MTRSANSDIVFLDANVLFAVTYNPRSDFRTLWSLPNTRILTSDYVVHEVQRNLLRLEQQSSLQTFRSAMDVTSVPETEPTAMQSVILPPRDRPVLAGAIASGATHLFTGDYRHFRRYYEKSIGGVLVLTPVTDLERRG